MSTLELTFEDMMREVCEYLGLGDEPGEDELKLAAGYVNEGYRQFLMGMDCRTNRAYTWSFVDPNTPPGALSDNGDKPLGGALFSSAIRAGALAAAEQASAGARGPNSERFEKLLAACIDIDAATRDLNIGRW